MDIFENPFTFIAALTFTKGYSGALEGKLGRRQFNLQSFQSSTSHFFNFSGFQFFKGRIFQFSIFHFSISLQGVQLSIFNFHFQFSILKVPNLIPLPRGGSPVGIARGGVRVVWAAVSDRAAGGMCPSRPAQFS